MASRRLVSLWRGFLAAPGPLPRRLVGLFFAVLPLPVRRPALRAWVWGAAFARLRPVRRFVRLAWRVAWSPFGFGLGLLLLAGWFSGWRGLSSLF